MNTALKMLLMTGGRGANGSLPSGVTWQSYVASLNPGAWWQFTEASSPALNYGSIGSGVNLVGTASTFGQTGKLGASQAVSADGVDTKLQCANNATLAGYTTWSQVYLLRPSTAGETSAGMFQAWGVGIANAHPEFRFSGALTALTFRTFNSANTQFTTTTTTGLTAATWAILIATFDNAGDRLVHIYKGVGGAVAEFAYSSQQAMTGTYKTLTDPFVVLNRSDQARAFDGLLDEFFIVPGILTAAQQLVLVQLAGV